MAAASQVVPYAVVIGSAAPSAFVSGGRVILRKATGGWSVRALALRGAASRPSFELFALRNILRLEAHPTARWMPAWLLRPHLHIDAIKVLSKYHIPIVEPLLAWLGFKMFAEDTGDADCANNAK